MTRKLEDLQWAEASRYGCIIHRCGFCQEPTVSVVENVDVYSFLCGKCYANRYKGSWWWTCPYCGSSDVHSTSSADARCFHCGARRSTNMWQQ